MATLPKVEVITIWYNEAFLAPFFLNNYAFADHIRIIDDVETKDNTYEIVCKYRNASIEYIQFPDGFDNDIAVAKLNKCYGESKADWVIAVDADEFVFSDDLHNTLISNNADVFYVRLYQVYRNVNDKDLDPSIPTKIQRRHGDENAVKGQNKAGMKPIVVRTGLKNMKWMPGQHNIWNRHRYVTSSKILPGVHWMMADPSFCVERRMRGRMRQSKQNIIRGNSSHYNTITEEQVREELSQHLNDQRLF